VLFVLAVDHFLFFKKLIWLASSQLLFSIIIIILHPYTMLALIRLTWVSTQVGLLRLVQKNLIIFIKTGRRCGSAVQSIILSACMPDNYWSICFWYSFCITFFSVQISKHISWDDTNNNNDLYFYLYVLLFVLSLNRSQWN